MIILIMIISSTYTLFELKLVSDSAKHMITANVRVLEVARQIRELIQDEGGYMEKYLISDDETYFSLFMETGKLIDQKFKLFDDHQSRDDRSLIHGMIKVHDAVVAGIRSKRSGVGLPDAGQPQAGTRNIDRLLQSIDDLINKNQNDIQNEISRIDGVTTRSVQAALILIAGSLMAAIVTAFIITRTITRPIGDLIRGTRQIALGNYEAIHVSSRDEISQLADAVNDMSSRINDTNKLRMQTMQQISHELKTPLQAAQSAHDVLKASKAVQPEKLKMLQVINTSVCKIADFSQQYLDLAKIESGAMTYNMEKQNLFEIVEPIVEESKLIAGSKEIRIDLDAVPAPKVLIDRDKVSMIVNNLISNAIKYTPSQGRIAVSVGPGDAGVQVQVKDTGIGIRQDEIPNIFTRFYRAGNTTDGNVNGSGVGLAIVKAYTEGHGGRIHVESRIDKGSLFRVDFPICCSPGPETQK